MLPETFRRAKVERTGSDREVEGGRVGGCLLSRRVTWRGGGDAGIWARLHPTLTPIDPVVCFWTTVRMGGLVLGGWGIQQVLVPPTLLTVAHTCV